jgi:hypothetical protein
MDCPICNGSGYENVIGTWLPHQNFGDSDCCGFLLGIADGELAYITCNDCDAVIQTLAAANLQRILTEMELTLDSCAELCPHCGKVNLMVGFSQMLLYTCRECGKVVQAGQ